MSEIFYLSNPSTNLGILCLNFNSKNMLLFFSCNECTCQWGETVNKTATAFIGACLLSRCKPPKRETSVITLKEKPTVIQVSPKALSQWKLQVKGCAFFTIMHSFVWQQQSQCLWLNAFHVPQPRQE